MGDRVLYRHPIDPVCLSGICLFQTFFPVWVKLSTIDRCEPGNCHHIWVAKFLLRYHPGARDRAQIVFLQGIKSLQVDIVWLCTARCRVFISHILVDQTASTESLFLFVEPGVDGWFPERGCKQDRGFSLNQHNLHRCRSSPHEAGTASPEPLPTRNSRGIQLSAYFGRMDILLFPP